MNQFEAIPSCCLIGARFAKIYEVGSENAALDVTTTEASTMAGFADTCRLEAMLAPIPGRRHKEGSSKVFLALSIEHAGFSRC
jgi:hypothetical protein